MTRAVQSTCALLRHLGAEWIGVDVPCFPVINEQIKQIYGGHLRQTYRSPNFHPDQQEEFGTSAIPTAEIFEVQEDQNHRSLPTSFLRIRPTNTKPGGGAWITKPTAMNIYNMMVESRMNVLVIWYLIHPLL